VSVRRHPRTLALLASAPLSKFREGSKGTLQRCRDAVGQRALRDAVRCERGTQISGSSIAESRSRLTSGRQQTPPPRPASKLDGHLFLGRSAWRVQGVESVRRIDSCLRRGRGATEIGRLGLLNPMAKRDANGPDRSAARWNRRRAVVDGRAFDLPPLLVRERHVPPLPACWYLALLLPTLAFLVLMNVSACPTRLTLVELATHRASRVRDRFVEITSSEVQLILSGIGRERRRRERQGLCVLHPLFHALLLHMKPSDSGDFMGRLRLHLLCGREPQEPGLVACDSRLSVNVRECPLSPVHAHENYFDGRIWFERWTSAVGLRYLWD
jgi:hypothetical protein